MKNANVSLRLILMNFLEFAVWGAYLTSMGSFLAKSGFGSQIWLFFATQGFVSIFMPALMGIIADKWIPAQKVLSLCHGLAGAAMLGAGFYAMEAGSGIQLGVFYALYTISVAFFMPTIAIANSVAYNALEKAGKDPVKDFPPIRVFGTVGFICSMLFVNFMRGTDGVQFQHTYNQFIVSGGLSIILCLYALSLPNCPCKPKTAEVQSFADSTGLSAFKLFKNGQFAIFFIFSMLLGAALQITNGYANTFITSFADNPEYAHTWGANNANALISLSQASETLCILLIPFFMKKFGIKKVMLIAMIAWVFRFGFFGLGNPGGGVWLFVLSCIVYGMGLALRQRARGQGHALLSPGPVHADDQRTRSLHRHLGRRHSGRPLRLQRGRTQLEHRLVHLRGLRPRGRNTVHDSLQGSRQAQDTGLTGFKIRKTPELTTPAFSM